MPAFLLHGVPDTAHLWDGVRTHLTRTDVIAPSMPGFATPLPDGFDCTKDAYAAWLIAEVEKVGRPVDVVGHDWGALLVQRLVSLRPNLIRTWAVGSGPLDRDYVWHDTAKTWQTPGAGEQLMAAFTPDVVVPVFTAQGIDETTARGVASRIDERMKSSVLSLYRSAINVSQDWTPLSAPVPPGLVLWGADDPYAGPQMARNLAERTDAKLHIFENCGHWWPSQRPKETAALLEAHWRSVA
jgi:pimeloyl-ACP methyl ester carboxylesterase